MAMPQGSPTIPPVLRPTRTGLSEVDSERTYVFDDNIRRSSRTPSPIRPVSLRYTRTYSSSGELFNASLHQARYSNADSIQFTHRYSTPPELPPPKHIRGSVLGHQYRKSTLSQTLSQTISHAPIVQYDEPQDSAIEHVGRLWTPWSLRLFTLLALLVFFLGCIAVLEVLSLLSKRSTGLGNWSENARYLWTYLPPLVFFTVASVWGQIEYRTKQLMPWRTMAAAPAAATHSILLNYITPLNISAFSQSIKLGHPGIAIVIAAGATVKLLILTSTAILSLQGGHLLLQGIPLRMMEAFLALMVILTSLVILVRPVPATPCDTSTLSGLATILSNSDGYNSVLKGLAAAPSESLEEEVIKHRYQTAVGYKDNNPFFRLCFVSKDAEMTPAPPRTAVDFSRPNQWWTPIHDATRLAILAAIFGAIVTLELLHQRSKKNNGIMNIDDFSPVRYAWQFLPALIAMILFSLVELVDYATRIIQPYHALKRGTAAPNRSIEVNYLSYLAPAALLKALRNRHWGVVFCATAILLAPLLTIFTAGLYFLSGQQANLPSNFRISASVDPGTSTPSANFAATANFVVSNGDEPWPQWTRDDLVFPALENTSSNASLANTLNIHVSAMYAMLNCTAVVSADLKTWISSPNNSSNSTTTTSPVTPNLAIPVEQGCGAPCRNTTDVNTCDGKSYIYTTLENPPAGAAFGSIFSAKSAPTPDGWRDSCPQISVAYGQSSSNGSQIEKLVVMNCYPAIMQASGNATFQLPVGIVTAADMDRKSAKRVAFGANATIDLNTILNINAPAELTRFDPTFTALTNTRDAIPASQLVGEENMPTVTAALEKLYARVMAQHLNLESRTTAATTSTTKSSAATTTPTTITGQIDGTRTRLMQDTTSTRILEALLAAIFILLVLSSAFADSRKVLPYNPCSIARMSALLAGSELVRGVLPVGSEWEGKGGKTWWEGYVFSLGVWEKMAGGRGAREKVFGVDVGVAVEKME